jgi:hypothetical protein
MTDEHLERAYDDLDEIAEVAVTGLAALNGGQDRTAEEALDRISDLAAQWDDPGATDTESDDETEHFPFPDPEDHAEQIADSVADEEADGVALDVLADAKIDAHQAATALNDVHVGIDTTADDLGLASSGVHSSLREIQAETQLLFRWYSQLAIALDEEIDELM